VTAVVIDPLASNVRAHRFYARLGFKPVGERRFGPDDCLVHELTRGDWRAASAFLRPEAIFGYRQPR
jgi:aminoglycoside 6'-N-acetyltransferase